MAKRKGTKEQTMIYKTLNKKLKGALSAKIINFSYP
jgi:hypothetical protein